MKNAGFSLLEILVVLFIISIVTSVALLSVRRNDSKQMEAVAQEITQMVILAKEQAMLQPAVLQLVISEHAYQFNILQQKHWMPMRDKLFGQHRVRENIQLNMQVNNHEQMIISADGDITPFTIYVSQRGGKPRYAIMGDVDGNVTSEILS